MYVVYETFTDETKNMKELRFNTRIIGIYKRKGLAIGKLEEHLNKILKEVNKRYCWFVKESDMNIIKDENKNIIKSYEIYNDYIDNIAEMYYVILEKVEVE